MDEWKSKAIGAVFVLLVVAVVARVVWMLLQPLLPGLFVIIVLATICGVLFRRRK